MIIPAAGLSLLAIYELAMDHWENSVRAPIRLDLFLEISLMLVFVVWGITACLFRSRKEKQLGGPRQRLSTCIRRQTIDLVRHNAMTYGRCRRTLPVLRPKTTSPFRPYDPTAAIQLQYFASPTRS